MKLKIVIALALGLLFLATEQIKANQSTGDKTPESKTKVEKQNSNQLEVKNMGEATQIQTANQEEQKFEATKDLEEDETESESLDDQDEEVSNATGSTGRSQTAEERMSQVAQEVENLLSSKLAGQSGIGQEVREIAQMQKTAQAAVSQQLQKLGSRSSLVKKLLGADQEALAQLQTLREQNQLRIEELSLIQKELKNAGDIKQVQLAIQALTEQDTALSEKIQAEQQNRGWLHWLKFLWQ